MEKEDGGGASPRAPLEKRESPAKAAAASEEVTPEKTLAAGSGGRRTRRSPAGVSKKEEDVGGDVPPLAKLRPPTLGCGFCDGPSAALRVGREKNLSGVSLGLTDQRSGLQLGVKWAEPESYNGPKKESYGLYNLIAKRQDILGFTSTIGPRLLDNVGPKSGLVEYLVYGVGLIMKVDEIEGLANGLSRAHGPTSFGELTKHVNGVRLQRGIRLPTKLHGPSWTEAKEVEDGFNGIVKGPIVKNTRLKRKVTWFV
ncbi:unnamed protein product [Linum trigynum]|uniref:Uncharacterized protein n=1 Tax=Linum trigynum TaxID=586398 RepID=A0AAV2CX45_9ROSI